MKRVILIIIIAGFGLSASAQRSPYVELLGVINNTNFSPTMQRATPLSRPVPIHTSGDAINRVVSPRFVLAKVDVLTSATWAVASGWTSASNSSAVGTVANPATGCNAYSELGAGVGTWRLPTHRELILIYLCRKEVAATLLGFVAMASDLYWSSTSSSNSDAWSVDFSSAIVYNRPKTSSYRVRCIRDL